LTVLAFHHVTLALGGREILSGVDLAIEAGEFIGLLGPNGAGKTTLLRAALGLVAPRAGEIHVFGAPARRGNPHIGTIPQSRSFAGAARLSGYDLVAGVVNGHRLGLPRLDRWGRREVAAALERVGARDLARRPLAELSGGERQRLLLAQALIGEPRLLLLDEPLINLDPRHQQEIVTLVRDVQRERNLTVIFTAHEINPLLEALDRVLYLGGGAAALGSVETVITGPVLSRLYGAPIEVVRLKGRIFVFSGHANLEAEAHRHEHDAEGGETAHAPHA
jgi:zinc/manganese transport system ATP-binding protein